MENEDVVSAEVSAVVEKLIEKIIALEERSKALEIAAHLQQQTIEVLGQAVGQHQTYLEVLAGSVTPQQSSGGVN